MNLEFTNPLRLNKKFYKYNYTYYILISINISFELHSAIMIGTDVALRGDWKVYIINIFFL